VSKIVTIAAYKGGVGKTTLALTPTPLRSAAHAYQTAIDDLARSAGLAA